MCSNKCALDGGDNYESGGESGGLIQSSIAEQPVKHKNKQNVRQMRCTRNIEGGVEKRAEHDRVEFKTRSRVCTSTLSPQPVVRNKER